LTPSPVIPNLHKPQSWRQTGQLYTADRVPPAALKSLKNL
jgi:hypothetical protein